MNRLLNVLFILVVAALSLAAQSRDIVVTLNESVPDNLKGYGRDFRTIHVGRDMHGALFQTSYSSGYPDKQETGLRVWHPDGKTTEFVDLEEKFVSTGLDYNDWPGSFRNPKGSCERENPGASEALVGPETFAGLSTFHYREDVRGVRYDSWFAPEVACFPIKWTETDLKTGTVTTKWTPMHAQVGGAGRYTLAYSSYPVVDAAEGNRRMVKRVYGSVDKAPKCIQDGVRLMDDRQKKK